MSYKKVAAVFATYNRLSHLKNAVESLRAAMWPGIGYDIVVVDGGSVDGSREWLASQSDVILIGQRGPLTGAVKAFNLGFSYAVENDYEYVLHFNDDAVLLWTGNGSGSVSPISSACQLMDVDKSIGEVAFEFDLRGSWAFEKIHGKTYGNFGLVRTEAGIAVAKAQGDSLGGKWWNPIYRTYGADTEFGCWLWKLGWRIHDGIGLRVHDVNAQDELRVLNGAHDPNRADSKIFWSRWPTAESLRPAADISSVVWKNARIHLGCGEKKLNGWLNIDALQCPSADLVMDFQETVKNIPSGSLREVYWSHGPEHVHTDKLAPMLSEIRRAMAPGGKFTVGTIDLVGIWENRFKTSKNGSSWNSALYGETRSTDPEWASHKQAFTEEYLTTLLSDAGFCDIHRWQPEESKEIADLNDYTMSCRLVTIALTCRTKAAVNSVTPRVVGIQPIATQRRVANGHGDGHDAAAIVESVPGAVDGRRWDVASMRDGVIVPVAGCLPPRVAMRNSERVLHVALRTPLEPQIGLENGLRSISEAYAQVDWLSDEHLGAGVGVMSIMSKARDIKPTVVFIQTQRDTFLRPGVVAEMRKLCDDNVVIINWDGDQHFEPQDARRRWFVDLGKVCDASLVVNTKHPAEYAALGVRHAGYMQIGVDSSLFRPVANPLPDRDRVVLLASNYNGIRSYDRRVRAAERLQSLLSNRFSVYGHGWSGLSSGRNLVHSSREAYVYAGATVSLSMSIRNDLPRYTSDRLFRSISCGAATIVESFPDHEGLGLRNGVNCIMWDGDVSELSLVMDLLDQNSDAARGLDIIRSNAAELGLSEHSWNARMGDLLAIVDVVRDSRK